MCVEWRKGTRTEEEGKEREGKGRAGEGRGERVGLGEVNVERGG